MASFIRKKVVRKMFMKLTPDGETIERSRLPSQVHPLSIGDDGRDPDLVRRDDHVTHPIFIAKGVRACLKMTSHNIWHFFEPPL